MTNYYVRTVANGGSDAAAGTSAGAAWATIGKALGAAGISSGDTVYVGPGVYREVVAVAMTSAVAETFIIGDVAGQYTGDAPGEIILSAYTTDDVTTPSTTALIDLAGRDNLTFQKIRFHGANQAVGSCVKATTSTPAATIKFTDCSFYAGATSCTLVDVIAATGAALDWTIDRCRFFAMTSGTGLVLVTGPTNVTADYDMNVQITNSMFYGGAGAGVYVTASGAGSFKAGGVDVKGCSYYGTGALLRTGSANISTSIPCTALDSHVITVNPAFSANTAGQITENYCRVASNTANSNVTNGANSLYGITSAPLFSIGHEEVVGARRRFFMEPDAGSGLLGFTASTSPTVDLLNRPRPTVGITNAAGAYERHDTATKETSVTDAGGVGIKITGPGDQDIQIPVAAAATVITVRCRFDTNHATTNKPQAILLANGEIGVTTETVTGAAAVDTWETLTFASQTPTAAGVVTIRLVSRSAAASGIAYFDSVTVA